MPVDEFSKTIPFDEFKKVSSPEKRREWIYDRLVRESNLIEGIDLDSKTFHSGDKEEYQLEDHIKAYEYVIQKHESSPTEKDIRDIHDILMHNIAAKENWKAGEYRKHASYIRHSTRTPDTINIINHFDGRVQYHHVPKAMQRLDLRIKDLSPSDVQRSDLWDIHYDYEVIHPFSDGNGRSGRLLLNWLSLKYFQEFAAVSAKDKRKYYSAIRDREKIFRESNPDIKFYKDRTEQVMDPLFRALLGF